jgi:hypothetical protein
VASVKGIKAGDRVVTADGEELGRVKQVRDACIEIQARKERTYWLATDAIQNRLQGLVLLRVAANHLDATGMNNEGHAGRHMHGRERGAGGWGSRTPLLLLGAAGFMALRDKERREKLLSLTRQTANKLESRLSSKPSKDSEVENLRSMSRTAGQGMGGGNASGTGIGDARGLAPPPEVARDEVDEASWESFPASDPPSRY